MFLFSGTFFPISIFPDAIEALIQLTPLYHGINLIRGLSTGHIDTGDLVAFFGISLWIAMRQMERKLIK
jgi:lipooligosaccharide transport system permease protein